jgi:hypothetical protein
VVLSGLLKNKRLGLSANEMAAQGIVSHAFEASFTGESGGEPRITVLDNSKLSVL